MNNLHYSGGAAAELRHRWEHRGFSLIELLIAVSIVSILAAVVYPAYTQQILRAGRTDAKTLLLQAQAREERYFGAHNRYAANMTTLGYAANVLHTDGNRYRVSVNASSANSFVLQAQPASGSSQAGDACGAFVIDQLGVQGIKNLPAGSTMTANKCWRK